MINEENKEKTITLTLTNSCNLSCIYCYEENKSRDVMSFDTAKKIIDNEFCVDDHKDKIIVDLFGGEPFLQFELIKQIDDYLLHASFVKKWMMFATTNGTLIHGEIQDWLKERPYFVCGLSFDGNAKMQNANRSNSFDMVDLDFFKTQYPEQQIKMTVSDKSLSDLFEGVKFLHEQGFRITCNLAYGIDWSDELNKSILERELMKLIKYYIEHPEIEPCSLLETDIKQIGYNDKTPNEVRKWCGAGTQMHTYDVYGNKYPCHFFAPLSVGIEQAEKAKSIVFQDVFSRSLLDKKCQDCPLINACPTCYGSNFAESGSIYKKDDNYCALMKIIIQARSYYYANLWQLKRLNLTPIDEQALLRAIKIIQNTI